MRLFIALVFLASMLIVPQLAAADQVTTIDELAAMYNVESCADCHEDIHNEWKESWHSKSITDPRVLRTWRTFILRGLDKSDKAKRSDLRMCLNCHIPQIKDASDDLVVQIAGLVVTSVDDKNKAKREAAEKELSKLNINCLVCHKLKGAPDGNPKPGELYGPNGLDDEDSPHMEELGIKTVKSDIIKTADFCARCHNGCQGLPSSICSSVVTSYNEQYVAHGGEKTCQDCHMPQGEDTKSHKFPGIFDVDFAKTGVDLKIIANPTRYIYHLENRVVPAVAIKVDLTNIAGHEWPHG
ncbi:hypothetical protein BMS3Abin10_01752 [bacterium BMS3Abin10]|nr:hypothetical protein BMS3Abin10_01752 [bacterium BMS3Abin10]GBE39103.1 hypothetical protein BMS3Bbin08_01721 [bacterium BMS3Bbin08]